MLTQARLMELLHYDLKTGIFTWLVPQRRHGSILAGSVAGYKNKHKNGKPRHIDISIDGSRYKAHRLAFLYVTGSFPELTVDHADMNPFNNAWSNLREATPTQNLTNVRARSKTGLKWAYVSRSGRFFARLSLGGTHTYLGVYDTAEEANAVAFAEAKKINGEFARMK